MNYTEYIYEYLAGRVTFPLTNYMLNRRGIISNYKKLLKSQWYAQDLLQKLQLERLQQIIEYADKYVPFYKSRFQEMGLKPQDIKAIEDLKKIPPLNRQDVINFHKDLVDIRLKSSIDFSENTKHAPGTPIPLARFRKHKLVRNTTSGSTGIPTVFYENGSRSALNWSHELRFKSWFDIKPGAKEARLVRLSTEFVGSSKANKLRKMIWRHLVLPGVNLSDEDYRLCLNEILTFKPKVLWGNPWALTGLAGYIMQHEGSLGSYKPELTITWSGPAYEDDEALLKKAFNCPTTNIYGTREVGHIAAKCHKGIFHINQENLIVEDLCLSDRQDTNGLEKEILVTTLDISPMPFIRYQIGDSGEVSQAQCNCGRSLLVLKNLHGRTGDIFRTKDGRMIAPNFWGRTFNSKEIFGAIKRFQIIYSKTKDIKIKIVKDDKHSIETENYLRKIVGKNFPADTMLEFEYVQKIPAQPSGKFQRVINNS